MFLLRLTSNHDPSAHYLVYAWGCRNEVLPLVLYVLSANMSFLVFDHISAIINLKMSCLCHAPSWSRRRWFQLSFSRSEVTFPHSVELLFTKFRSTSSSVEMHTPQSWVLSFSLHYNYSVKPICDVPVRDLIPAQPGAAGSR
jgi:hypothetical protein